MKQELTKILTSDNIELAGILYTPKTTTKKIVVHVHGLAGNFYENSFVDFQAKTYTENNYAYFPFNNRGNGYFIELIKKEDGKTTYPLGGCAFETIEDSHIDIQAAVNYVKSLGYDEIILQGHSFGCSKIIYYYNKEKSDEIKNIILLAPCDMIKLRRNELGNSYNQFISKAQTMISNNEGNKLINYPGFPPFDLSAKSFCSIYLENCSNDIFRYRETNYKSEILNKIEIPVLIQIGEKDKYALSEDKEVITKYFNDNIKDYNIKFISESNHGYYNKEQIMSDNCIDWLNKKS